MKDSSTSLVVLIFLSVVAMIASAQSSRESSTPQADPRVRPALPQLLPESREQGSASRKKVQLDETRSWVQAQLEERLLDDTRVRGYWVDSSTGLVWAGHDNGSDVNLQQATKYCHDLDLAGYSNWRLPTIDELQGIYDGSASVYLPPGKGSEYIIAGRPKGGLILTNTYHWSSSRVDGGRRNPGGDVWEFDFLFGRRHSDPSGYSGHIRALCVRRSDIDMAPQSSTEDQGLAQETQARGYWVDPSTKLMWQGRDNGKDVTWGQARKYCRDLRLAGYLDWRLATLDELDSLVSKRVIAPEIVGNTVNFYHLGGDLRGNLSWTGNSWSSNRPLDRFHHQYSDGWFFDFRTLKPSYDLQLFRNTKRVLCVRRSGE